ncbi:DUF2637 domain-containing protein [Nocardiopsis mangrovi]|uniref:DUF2637 domain-containing protein n=1 Tax=Nocardiopsis mangrovi TaxID=1179818 RepID=A0ABV9DYL9_9ACTN
MDSSRWSRWRTLAAVLMLAAIAAVVSYSHRYDLAQPHGEPQLLAAFLPRSVDDMIVASSMALLADAPRGRRGGRRGSGADVPRRGPVTFRVIGRMVRRESVVRYRLSPCTSLPRLC